jgi:protein involved in polysaccharide export with SLBB domain
LGPPALNGAAAEKYSPPPPEFFRSHSGGTVVLAPGDVITVRFYYNPDLNRTVKIREDGRMSLDLFQGIPVAGLTPEELQKKLAGMYSREFTNPDVTVDVDSQANASVYVTGEVVMPGAKDVHGRVTVAMILAMSQMNQRTSGAKSVFLIRPSEDGKYRVYKLDASFPAGTGRDLEVRPGDILFVPRKRIVQVDDFIDQYICALLPATPSANLGVIFTPGSPITASAATTH